LFALSLAVPLSVYVGLASLRIAARVGYQMDEGLYVESAVYMLRGGGVPPFLHDAASWITIAGRRLPLMIIPYVGAAKAYVVLPLFAIFGISPEVARFSGVLLGSLGIAGLVVLLGTAVSPAAGLLAGLALAIHPSYLAYTVFDNGGVSVWMAALGLAALALTHYLRRRSILSALLLGLAAGLGVWARVNLLWLFAAAVAAALLVLGRRAIPAKGHVAAMMTGGCLGALPLVFYEVTSRLATLRFMSDTREPLSAQRIAQRLRGLGEVMISSGEHRGIWAGPPLAPWEMGIGAVLLALALFSQLIRLRSEDPGIARWRRAFAAATAVMTAIMLTSHLGISQHHLVAVLPLAFAALAILSLEVASRSRRAVPLLAAAAAGLAVLFLSWDVRIDRGLRETGGKWYWSSAIYDVHAYLRAHPVPPGRLKILSWGFQNNLYVISGGSVYGSELFWGATKALSYRGMTWASEIRDGGSFLLFRFQPNAPAVKGFSQALRDYPGPRRKRLWLDRSGSPYAALVEIMPVP
jgi:hypothetical protein